MTDTLQDGSYGPSCKGAGLAALAAAGAGITGQSSSSLTGALSGLNASSIPSSSPLAGLLGLNAAEDCLFLDLYVPSNALSGHAKLPVINWIYGGAYIGGSKDGLYAGTPLVKQSGGNVIFVAGNYRLAAFGFLCGSTPEREKATSVAFWDQRAVLEWIQKYIHLVGGDAHEVSAWGESAGAGSIEHQLVQFGGRQDPLFSKAVIQSPAFEQLYDRRGALQDTYEQLERLAGCAGEGLDCLRSVSTDAINNASNAIINAAPPGTFGFGPCADGSFIRQLPALEFASGNYWKGIKSLVLSHVADEAEIFVAPNITTNAEVTSYLTSIYSTAPNTIINAVLQQYPPAGNGSKYTTVFNRVKGFIQDSSFVCNVRSLTDAYRGRTYNVQYSRGSGLHGTDISADFYDPTNALSTLLAFRDQNISQFAPSYQSYLVSHARTGDPNTYRNTSGQFPTIEWPKVTDQRNANYLSNVLYAGDAGYSLFSDNETSRDACGFWTNIGAAVTGLGGQSHLTHCQIERAC